MHQLFLGFRIGFQQLVAIYCKLNWLSSTIMYVCLVAWHDCRNIGVLSRSLHVRLLGSARSPKVMFVKQNFVLTELLDLYPQVFWAVMRYCTLRFNTVGTVTCTAGALLNGCSLMQSFKTHWPLCKSSILRRPDISVQTFNSYSYSPTRLAIICIPLGMHLQHTFVQRSCSQHVCTMRNLHGVHCAVLQVQEKNTKEHSVSVVYMM